jgi:predicted  nucleic acid-binding Zn-ribbon protein
MVKIMNGDTKFIHDKLLAAQSKVDEFEKKTIELEKKVDESEKKKTELEKKIANMVVAPAPNAIKPGKS